MGEGRQNYLKFHLMNSSDDGGMGAQPSQLIERTNLRRDAQTCGQRGRFALNRKQQFYS